MHRPPEDYESSGKNSAKNQEPVAKVAILGARQSETIGNGMEPPNRTPQTLDRRRPNGSVVDGAALMFLQPLEFPGNPVDLPLKFGCLAFGLPLATDDMFKLNIQLRFLRAGRFPDRALTEALEQRWESHRT